MQSSTSIKPQKIVTGADLFLSLYTQPHELADWFEPSDDFEDTVSFDNFQRVKNLTIENWLNP